MNQENGTINIHTENIFPIIKKWLYSDRDIFVRELIANGVDAVNKLKRLSDLGEIDIPEDTKYFIKVGFNKNNKTIRFTDNGIGMTGEEVKKYINQIAFSGAEEFIAKYKDEADEGSQIIGHFGLGFYSAFMVAERVEIDTLSYQEGAEAVHWVCAGGTEYELTPSERSERGTNVLLVVGEDSADFLDESKLREIINKYCAFMPVEIFLENEEEKKEDEKEEPTPLNDTQPLWLKDPKECTDEEYKEFYHKVFFDFREPLFWIHLNVDYPFNLKGILYFPRIDNEFDHLEGKIKLFNNQVFVADNIKEVIPEFLLLLKGVIDCKDLPLNVSRSFLQKDANVIKISKHITKKVSDKLSELFKGERERYNNCWDDINPFVKFGCIKEEKFYDRVKDIILYKTINGDYQTLNEYLTKNKDDDEKKVFYVTDEKQQAQYVNLFKAQELDAVVLPAAIDLHFIQFIEDKEDGVKFHRIDSDLSESLKGSSESAGEEIQEKLSKVFKEVLGDDKLKVQVDSLKTAEPPAMILLAERSRRFLDMSNAFGRKDLGNMFPGEETLVLNRTNDLVDLILKMRDLPEREEDVKLICQQIYDLALISHKRLEPGAMTEFLNRSSKILTILARERSQG
ncbi:MAG: molecular chaperone HtpG [Desulfitobacteriaceae bacterium]|nr:molecular chaperone HtpG [Desulfitobacteriaceae bacterium]